jgi:hypothetical protein
MFGDLLGSSRKEAKASRGAPRLASSGARDGASTDWRAADAAAGSGLFSLHPGVCLGIGSGARLK